MSEYSEIDNLIKNYHTPDGTYLTPRQCNDLSHIFGGYRLNRKYGALPARIMEIAKEPLDLAGAILPIPNSNKIERKIKDTIIDLHNGKIGEHIYKENPNMSDKQALDYVYNTYIKNNLK